ncbi:MAG: hypothetical protein LAO78_28290, partial [Acidobacteriia bacterium]|nr:hypothetical protein [Terriglobia bacterium]
ASDSFRMPMICSSLNRLFLTSPPPPWRAILMEKSHSVWTISGGAGQCDVEFSGRMVKLFERAIMLPRAVARQN